MKKYTQEELIELAKKWFASQVKTSEELDPKKGKADPMAFIHVNMFLESLS